jgi:acyl dehydratase
MDTIYYEDLEVGEVHHLGRRTVTEEEIIAFAEKYDPQPFHVDPERGEESPFGSLIASGLHTMALSQKFAAEQLYIDAAMLGGPGMENVNLPRPVRPGDELTFILEIADKRPMESDPTRGIVRVRNDVYNHCDELVLTYVAISFVERRTDAAE